MCQLPVTKAQLPAMKFTCLQQNQLQMVKLVVYIHDNVILHRLNLNFTLALNFGRSFSEPEVAYFRCRIPASAMRECVGRRAARRSL